MCIGWDYENGGCVGESNSLINQFPNKLNECKAQGTTAQLRIQCLEMVSIALDFKKSQSFTANKAHIDVVKKMLSYFNSSGLFPCATLTHLYLQDIKLKDVMDQKTFANF